MPKISVIIPHLNQHEHLRRCLFSLEEQTFEMNNVEIIVVDNGSTQLPLDICTKFNARLEQELEPGPGPARNKGVMVSRAKILAFIDSDCLADKNWLTTIAKSLPEQGPVQIIGGDVRIAYDDPNNLTMLEAYESIYAYRQQEYIERKGYSGTGNLAMLRDTFEAVGLFAGIDIAEDSDWGRRAKAMGCQTHYIADMVVYHPARRNMAELYTKWDRHVSHDFFENVSGVFSYLRWILKAVAVAGSPVFELRRLATSDRVNTVRQRLLAALALTRIRIYRAWQMLRLSVMGKRGTLSGAWNRE